MINTLSILILLITLIGIIVFMVTWVPHRFSILEKKLKKEVTETEHNKKEEELSTLQNDPDVGEKEIK